MGFNYLLSLSHYIPELILCLTMVFLVLIESTYRNDQKEKNIFLTTLSLGLLSSFIALLFHFHETPVMIFTGSIVIDSFGTFLKILIVLGTMGVVYLGQNSNEIEYSLKSEFFILLVGVLIGGMLLISANNLLVTYIGIETLSILSYALASFNKRDERSSEAGLKYSLYGGVVSAVMLFGMSHIFGMFGTLNFTEMIPIMSSLTEGQVNILIPSFLFFMAGIAYKIACFPFHMWAPDVYEGAPLPITTFFAIVPKLAGMGIMMRVTKNLFLNESPFQDPWMITLSTMAVLTMTVGNISAIKQRSLKRMLAFSSISHAGFMLLGVILLDQSAMSAVLFYSAIYLSMTLVAFFILSFIQNTYGNDHLERFSGMIHRYPLMAIIMSITMFSLSGLPPLAGFVAKFNILSSLIIHEHYTLAVFAVINSVISLSYYLNIVRVMILGPTDAIDKIEGFSFTNQAIICLLVFPIIFLGIFWSSLIHTIEKVTLFVQN